VVRRVKREERGEKNQVKTTTCEFEQVEHKDIPESMFTLTAFGLPEMESERPWWHWRRHWLGLLSLAVFIGLLAAVIRARKRGAKDPGPGTAPGAA
jgi:hypothetical protein